LNRLISGLLLGLLDSLSRVIFLSLLEILLALRLLVRFDPRNILLSFLVIRVVPCSFRPLVVSLDILCRLAVLKGPFNHLLKVIAWWDLLLISWKVIFRLGHLICVKSEDIDRLQVLLSFPRSWLLADLLWQLLFVY